MSLIPTSSCDTNWLQILSCEAFEILHIFISTVAFRFEQWFILTQFDLIQPYHHIILLV